MNILYVEDNYINRLVVQKVLQPMGDVKMARTGPEAIEMASLHSFDIILIDINLNDPEMDGIDVMEIAKKNLFKRQFLCGPDRLHWRRLESEVYGSGI